MISPGHNRRDAATLKINNLVREFRSNENLLEAKELTNRTATVFASSLYGGNALQVGNRDRLGRVPGVDELQTVLSARILQHIKPGDTFAFKHEHEEPKFIGKILAVDGLAVHCVKYEMFDKHKELVGNPVIEATFFLFLTNKLCSQRQHDYFESRPIK